MFAPHLAPIFATMGTTATYTAPDDAPVVCRAIRQGGGQTVRLGTVDVVLDRVRFHVLRSAIPAPQIGATLEVNGTLWTVQASQPVEADSHGLKWSLDAAWGAPVVWRSMIVSAPQNPPSISGALVMAATATAGVSVLSLKATGITGKLITGDKITVGGSTHTVTAPVTAASGVLVAIPVTPPLPVDVASGASATLEFIRDVPVVAAIGGYRASESQSGISVGDVRMIVLAGAAAGLPEPPKVGDAAFLPGRSSPTAVKAVSPIYAGASLVGYEIQVR